MHANNYMKLDEPYRGETKVHPLSGGAAGRGGL